ncbi:MAG: hypothetical protein P8N54_02500 [Flavobacteriales bacterium]|nr:hypothetical protein [Flavobacteriales bacterium]
MILPQLRKIWTRYYSYRKNYYRTLRTKYKDGKYYRKIEDRIKKIKIIKTSTEIKLLPKIKLQNTKLNDIIKLYGQPNYIIDETEILNIKILYYKKKIGPHKIKLEFHLYKKHLFFYSYDFSHEKSNNNIVKLLRSKYIKHFDEDIRKIGIIDHHKNIILVNNTVNLSILYVSGNNIVLHKITKSLKHKETKEKRKIKNSYNKLFKRL